ncbi:MAG: CpsD/CapB family tyrosine-protein kinase [Deltaproteobacteria bacterium]|nr:CpsD/CapB family tyrosine-protein kinase [Deltaproteobacteria bacterium]
MEVNEDGSNAAQSMSEIPLGIEDGSAGSSLGGETEALAEVRTQSPSNRGRNELYQGLILLAEGYIESVPAAEKFRILRARLDRLNLGKTRFQALAVTSAVPAEGKSVVAVNLARALSSDPTGKTLLIDCDLRRPTVHKFFRLNREGGLSDALFTKKISNNFIRSVGPGLDVMTAGTPVVDAAQTVERPELAIFLQQFKRYYRYVVIDCPPTLLCPEPITLNSLADATLLVVRGWRTDRRLVKEAVNALGKEKLLGVVMNEGIDPAKQYLDYGYYGYYSDQSRAPA